MKPLFLIPFATGVFHSIAIKEKKEKQWGTTLSILGTSSAYLAASAFRDEYVIKPEHKTVIPTRLSVPGFLAFSLFASCLHTGAFFCMGHLLTKKAYPVFMDE